MAYHIQKARIELQCDNCCARTQISAESVRSCIREAKDEGWKLGQVDQNYRGKLKCPGCAKK